jgi:hypothetical protein
VVSVHFSADDRRKLRSILDFLRLTDPPRPSVADWYKSPEVPGSQLGSSQRHRMVIASIRGYEEGQFPNQAWMTLRYFDRCTMDAQILDATMADRASPRSIMRFGNFFASPCKHLKRGPSAVRAEKRSFHSSNIILRSCIIVDRWHKRVRKTINYTR